jgi:hypothetical protein
MLGNIIKHTKRGRPLTARVNFCGCAARRPKADWSGMIPASDRLDDLHVGI